jgi:branched-chain amino acid transport system ATP-binding protein
MIALHHWRDNGPGISDARHTSCTLCAGATAMHEAKQYRDGDNVRVRAERKNKAQANTDLPSASLRMEGDMILGDTILETRGLA